MIRTKIWIFTEILQTSCTLLLSKYCTCAGQGGGEENDQSLWWEINNEGYRISAKAETFDPINLA